MVLQTRRLFVYGTLLRGEPNNALLGSSPFLSSALTPAAFTLYDLGEYPGLAAGGAHAIAGELYEVDLVTLSELDRFEGHPHLFERRAIVLATHADVQTYYVARAPTRTPVIEAGDWRLRRR